MILFGCWSAGAVANDKGVGQAMALVVIDLQEGFSDDTVVIQVNGREAFHKLNVETDYAIGRADSVAIQVPEGPVRIEVRVPSKGLSDSQVLEAAEKVYVGVSIVQGKINFRLSHEEFLYF